MFGFIILKTHKKSGPRADDEGFGFVEGGFEYGTFLSPCIVSIFIVHIYSQNEL
jgi:hypothetical protein